MKTFPNLLLKLYSINSLQLIVTDNNSPKYTQFLYLRITLRNYKILHVSIPVGSLPGVCTSNNLV